MSTLYVTMGIPGSGKSTWVERFSAPVEASATVNGGDAIVIVSPDQIRLRLTGDMSDQSKNAVVFSLAHQQTRSHLALGHDVIFDATCVTTRARTELLDIVKDNDVIDGGDIRAELHVFDTAPQVCLDRNAARERKVPEDIIMKMFGQFAQSLSQIGFEKWDVIHFYRS